MGQFQKVSTSAAAGSTRPLLQMLYHGESRGLDYNAFNAGTLNTGNGRVRHSGHYQGLTNMTIGQILNQHQGDGNNPQRLHVVGRGQFTHDTLKGLVDKYGISHQAKFTPELQDYLMIKNMPKAVNSYLSGQSNNMVAAQIALAREWRSVADPRTGKTYADQWSKANHAAITPAQSAQVLMMMRRNRLGIEL